MSYRIDELRAMSDEKLVEEHDEHAKHVVMGTQYYIDELNRRSSEKMEKTMYELSRDTQKLATYTFWLSAGALIVSVASIIITTML